MVSRLAPLIADPVSQAPAWTMYAADGLVPLAAIDTYEEATIIGRYNAVSSWEISLPTDTEACQALLTAARPRVVISTGAGVVFRSGPPIDFARTVDGDTDMTTITGVDDLAWLARRVAHPQPGSTAPPYSSTAYDVRTALAGAVIWQYININAGPAAIPARQVPDLTCPSPTGDLGPTITRRLRYQNLLEAMVRIADAYGLGIEILDMELRIFRPTGTARFSTNLGTLAGYEATYTAPEGNYVYAAGSGEGTARVIVEVADTESVAAWGRVETFLDQRSVTNPTDLASEAAGELTESVTPPVISIQAIETEGQRFGVDWGLGSLARVWLDQDADPIEDVIREVTIELRGNTPPSIRPSLGGTVDVGLWRELARNSGRIRNLEVR